MLSLSQVFVLLSLTITWTKQMPPKGVVLDPNLEPIFYIELHILCFERHTNVL
jgi:hypothetical protein